MYTAKSVIACLGVSVGANCRTMGFFKQNQTGDGANELAVAQHCILSEKCCLQRKHYFPCLYF